MSAKKKKRKYRIDKIAKAWKLDSNLESAVKYISKSGSEQGTETAIAYMLEAKRVIDAEIKNKNIQLKKIHDGIQTIKRSENAKSRLDPDTGRFLSRGNMPGAEKQMEAAKMYANGISKNDIAEKLQLGVKTVSTYISRGNKLLANNNVEAATESISEENDRNG